MLAELLVMAFHHVQTCTTDSRLTLQVMHRYAQQVALDKEALWPLQDTGITHKSASSGCDEFTSCIEVPKGKGKKREAAAAAKVTNRGTIATLAYLVLCSVRLATYPLCQTCAHHWLGSMLVGSAARHRASGIEFSKEQRFMAGKHEHTQAIAVQARSTWQVCTPAADDKEATRSAYQPR